ncbi:MAG TPA: UDP-N-acetylmuramoyl-tripeptide--D-alanyl-D-alanine ligase, partial [Flavitalea sp.]|nr:UDP-N-acetylmuramoyl-tripeptide--D-alanyl-D-alanine ligase [Flavitalea sp.]
RRPRYKSGRRRPRYRANEDVRATFPNFTIMTIEELYKLYLKYPSPQTDTRSLKNGDIFFALKGPNFNGNEFAEQALDKGAAYVVADEKLFADNERIILVKNVLQTLQDLAKHHRQQFTIPFIAITGSNGKTTTKELIHAVLSARHICYTTKGNLNNHIGIPLTILSVRSDAAMAVIEMGANHLKEIASYCEYTLPTHGIITNCGKAHLEGFGSIEGVRKGKGELYDYLKANQGSAFVMWDYEYLREMSKGIPEIITYGTTNASVTGTVNQQKTFLSVSMTSGIDFKEVNTQLVGDYNLPNVLVAITVGKYFNVPDEAIRQSIENYSPSNSRSQLIKKNGATIILDAYNANPSSMKAAIENFANIQGNQKILILGAMAELGSESLQEHQEIINLLTSYKWSDVVLVGGDFTKLTSPYKTYNSAEEAADWLAKQPVEGSSLLIKGSRSMKMEKVLESL